MCLIHVVDRMAVVQELMAVKQFKIARLLVMHMFRSYMQKLIAIKLSGLYLTIILWKDR